MLIDWFTVGAQGLNFVILVWLMKRVLYKPVMAAIDARETLVAAELADAAATKSDADKAAAEFKDKNMSFDRERAALLATATEDAKTRNAQLLEAARVAADALQTSRRNALQREMNDLNEEVGRRAQLAFFALARRAFKDLANRNLEDEVIALFCERLRAMKKEDKDKLALSMDASSAPASVRSAFELPLTLQATIQTAINETLERAVALRFEIAPRLVSGIELTAQGQRIGWSIAEYLTVLERDMADAITVAEPPTSASPVALTAVA